MLCLLFSGVTAVNGSTRMSAAKPGSALSVAKESSLNQEGFSEKQGLRWKRGFL